MLKLKCEPCSVDLSLSISTVRDSCCACKVIPQFVQNKRTLSHATEHRPNITVTELLRDYLPFEKAITPTAVNYEMIRTFAIPRLTSDDP